MILLHHNLLLFMVFKKWFKQYTHAYEHKYKYKYVKKLFKLKCNFIRHINIKFPCKKQENTITNKLETKSSSEFKCRFQ